MTGETADPAPAEERPTEKTDDPKALLASANEASGPARNAWIAFAGLIAYLLVTLAGVTHVDLLLNSPVTLPIVNVAIPLFSFFLFAPFLFLLVHLGLLVQHVMVAHKYHHFTEALATEGGDEGGNHPDRRLVHNYVFSQLLAGPRPPWALRLLMRLMVTFSLIVLPVLVLLYFQIKFLPYHDVAVTHAHRLAIFLDLVILCVVWPFIEPAAPDPRLRTTIPGRPTWRWGSKAVVAYTVASVGFALQWLFHGTLRLGNQTWRWETKITGISTASASCLFVLFFSVAVATVPQGCVWPFDKQEAGCFSLDAAMTEIWAAKVTFDVEEAQEELAPSEGLWQSRRVFAPTKWLFEGTINPTTGEVDSLFSRNLVVTDKDLVDEKNYSEGDKSLPLRGRNLKYAVLDRSDLRYADLYDSDLRGASARATDLRFAVLEKAQMQEADLLSAEMQGADLSYAQIQGADLRLAQMQGAVLSEAQMQGAALRDAQLQGADVSYANLQGADLSFAGLQGADFTLANLQGADLSSVQMQGADFTFAEMQMADLRGAQIWQTPSLEMFSRELVMPMETESIAPLEQEEVSALENLISDNGDDIIRERLETRLRPLLQSEAAESWRNSTEHIAWIALSESAMPDATMLGDGLADLACGDLGGGHVINGIASRAIEEWLFRDPPHEFPEYAAARLVDTKNCGAAIHLSEETRMQLGELARSLGVKTEPKPGE